MKNSTRLLSLFTSKLRLIDGRVFFRSGRATGVWSAESGIPMALPFRQPRAKIYVSVLAWLRFRMGRRIAVDAVYVTPLHRFGNAIHQLGNASLVAHRAGVKNVIIGKNDLFQNSVVFGDAKQLAFRLPPPRFWWQGQAVLVGRFFWNDEFPGTCDEQEISGALRGIGASVIDPERVRVWGEQDLVIHVRGGDVFGEPAPVKYGQPPLSFYTFILSSTEWSRVVLVSEDRKNPVLDQLVSHCKEQGIPCDTFSDDLLSDLHVLAGAQNLVVATGSFGRAAIACSDHIRAVYEFEHTGFLYPLPPGVRLHRVIDGSGQYRREVLSNNWLNTAKQRSMMLAFPQSHLRWEDSRK